MCCPLQTMVQILEENTKKKEIKKKWRQFSLFFSAWSFQSMLGSVNDMSDYDLMGICHNEIPFLDKH